MIEIPPSELPPLTSEDVTSSVVAITESSNFETEKQPKPQKILVLLAEHGSELRKTLLPLLDAKHLDYIVSQQAVFLDSCFSGELWDTAILHRNFERLVRTYQSYLKILAYRILGNWYAAEDVV